MKRSAEGEQCQRDGAEGHEEQALLDEYEEGAERGNADGGTARDHQDPAPEADPGDQARGAFDDQ